MQPSRVVQALSGDAALLRMLGMPAFRGRVHSVFDRVINIEDSRGELVTIASREVDNAPNTLVVDLEGFASTPVRAADPSRSRAASLVLGGRFAIRLAGASAWDARLPRWPEDESRLRDNLAAVQRHIGRGIGRASWPKSALEATMLAVLDKRVDALRAALCRGDVAAACTQGKAMLGLGPGLTPSGDDFLVGLFAVLHIAQSPCERLNVICADIVADAGGRTNAISAAALAAAGRGRVRESIHALLRALISGDRDAAIAALRPVLAIGSTSGADITAGIVAGFEAHLNVGAVHLAWKARSQFRVA